ncbi:peptidase S8 [Paenibacillus yonginensis]|uniref:Peptidase S8 n=1 Tax=Paenibacillus yonginensis TaxID=1462996 RepID=A0A1B1N4G1_9BACL|nr:S8 family peptidase [Paenibacillus yonginensis]ANS76314.1 peptidase S8 [Paenibacillus yonginensis]
MNIPELLRFLSEYFTPSRDEGSRHILSFRNPSDYEAFLNELQLNIPGINPEVRQTLKEAVVRQGLAGSLESADLPPRFRRALRVEEDFRVNVHALAAQEKQINPGIPWGVRRIRAPEVWSQSTGLNVRIGIVDTGVDFGHPDLKYCLARGVNLLSRHHWPHDDNGHGTHIAGTIAAAGGAEGITGVAPRAILYPVKAFDNNGAAYVSDIIRGIDWCVQNGMQIINMSFGMKKKSAAMEEVVERATAAGVVIVASAGNDKKKRNIDYPAKLPQTISVGATNRERRIAGFSNLGPYIDIYAPGDQIRSSWLGGKHRKMNGTSMATSHVSGAIALLLAKRPGLTPAEIKSLLRRTARPLSPLEDRTKGTTGELDAYRLVRRRAKPASKTTKKKV